MYMTHPLTYKVTDVSCTENQKKWKGGKSHTVNIVNRSVLDINLKISAGAVILIHKILCPVVYLFFNILKKF